MDRLWPRVWQLACTPRPRRATRATGTSTASVTTPSSSSAATTASCARSRTRAAIAAARCARARAPSSRRSAARSTAGRGICSGRLREVPSRREFGVLNDDLPLIPVEVDSWGPLVFVNFDPHRRTARRVPRSGARRQRVGRPRLVPLHRGGVDPGALQLEDADRRLQRDVSRAGHPSRDAADVRRRQRAATGLARGTGSSSSRTGSRRRGLRDRPDDQQVWEAFVQIMGNRVGRDLDADAGPGARVAPGLDPARRDRRRSSAHARRARGLDYSHFTLDQTLNMSQYNLFPNITVLVFSDMLNVVRSRPGATHLDAYMDAFTFERRPPAADAPRSRPFEMELDPTRRPPARHRAQPGPRELRAQPAGHAPTRPHPPHGLADRGVPHRQPARATSRSSSASPRPSSRAFPPDRPIPWSRNGRHGHWRPKE